MNLLELLAERMGIDASKIDDIKFRCHRLTMRVDIFGVPKFLGYLEYEVRVCDEKCCYPVHVVHRTE